MGDLALISQECFLCVYQKGAAIAIGGLSNTLWLSWESLRKSWESLVSVMKEN